MPDVLTLAQVKAQLRILSGDEDVYLESLIDPAREWVEDYTKRLLGEREVVLHFNDFSAMRLNVWPVEPDAEVSISYYDLEGLAQTIPDARVILGPAFVDILPPHGHSWPRTNSFITVTVTAGIPADKIPKSLTHAMLMLIAHWNENREGTESHPSAAKTLCNPYRVRMLA